MYKCPFEMNSSGRLKFITPEGATLWVNWLKNTVKLPSSEILKEVDFQCEDDNHFCLYPWEEPDYNRYTVADEHNGIEIWRALVNSISDIKFPCSICGKLINYGECDKIENKVLLGSESKVISRGLTGGSVVRQITNKYSVYKIKVCRHCAIKETRKRKFIKILKYVLIGMGIIGFFLFVHTQVSQR